MREIILGTAGHVDHGKTSFVKALTGIETDRLKEEKKRGITIELGFAFLDLPCGHRLGIVDVPGHEKFVKNMVAGATGIDILAFIIAADEGIMPQTREHFEICRLLGVSQGIVIITKKDMVDEDWLEMVEEEVHSFIAGSFLEGAPVVSVSSITGEGIDEVKELINGIVASLELNDVFGPFRLPIDRIFAMKGFGSVVTGTSISGRTAVGDELMLYPADRVAKIRGIQVHSTPVPVVEAGHRTAINLQGVDVSEVRRGMVAATPGTLMPSYMLDCSLHYLKSNTKPLKHRTRVRVHIGTAEILGRVSLLDRDELQPGDDADIQLLLEEPIAVWPKDNYVIRSYSPVITVGGGAVLGNVSRKKRKRVTDNDRQENSDTFQVLRSGSDEELLLLFLRESGTAGLLLNEIGVRLGIFGKQLKKFLSQPLSKKRITLVDSSAQRYLDTTVLDKVTAAILEFLHIFHTKNPLLAGLAKEELRAGAVRHIDQKLFSYCLQELIKCADVVQEGAYVRLASHQVALQADEEEIKKELLAWYKEKGVATATVKETAANFQDYPEKTLKEVFNLLFRDGKLVKVSETLYYHREIIDSLQREVVAFIEREGDIDAPRFKDLTGLTRKFSIPILEYFDRIKLTYRIDDKRVLRKRNSS